ncbi:4'-phosphopantetheinyl transferase [Gordonia sp. HY442]|uniref:4'-phosphopantetheinyl transferase family protein n=1 Tax=Gordonia zhenghanii TaxID=2911516 RepID=UPI001F1A90F9|nr:4'-phosphopantetheinyl transferase [Gordonia zhenghanii]MCF8602777.1 4'-phosphopantetheinyl transferase [Gordonia zhenghanii]
MISRLVPAGVGASEAFDDPPGLTAMPAEDVLIAKAVEKRRREFITARHCARQALGQLGFDPVPIMRGERGMPLWPSQVVGSMTHCDGYRGAVVAYSMQVRSLGIDAEPHLALPDGVLDHTSVEAERDVLATRDDSIHWDRLLFCAKEATYKAWFPLTQRWLGFEDAHITFERDADSGGDAVSGTFSSRILIDGVTIDGGAPLLTLPGRWRVADGLILTTIALT